MQIDAFSLYVVCMHISLDFCLYICLTPCLTENGMIISVEHSSRVRSLVFSCFKPFFLMLMERGINSGVS